MGAAQAEDGGTKRKVVRENPLDRSHDTKRALYHCNYCQKDISSVPRIKCAICPDYDLCLECFSVGLELTPHRREHDYRVIDNLSFPLYHIDWAADEEILLLEAIDMFGIGNWPAVAEHVGSKGKAECQAHYYQVYIDSDSSPLPTLLPGVASILSLPDDKAARSHLRGWAKAGHLNALGPPAADGNPEEGAVQPAAAAGGLGLADGLGHATAPAAAGGTAMPPPATAGDADDALVPVKELAGEDYSRRGQPSAVHAGGLSSSADAESDHHSSGKGTKRQRHEQSFREAAMLDAAAEAAAAPEPHVMVGARSVHHGAPIVVGAPGEAGPGGSAVPQGAAAAHAAAPPAGGAAKTTVKGTVAADAAAAAKSAVLPSQGRGAVDPAVAAAAAAAAAVAAGMPIPEATGYHVKRREFEPDYDNDAEAPIADIEFSDADTPLDRQLKLDQLVVYNARLEERARRRDFILEQGLLNAQRAQAQEKRRTPADKEAHARLRVFSRYQPQAQHDELVDGLMLEHKLRARIQELKDYRRAGVRSFADAEAFEGQRRRQRTPGSEGAAAALGPAHVRGKAGLGGEDLALPRPGASGTGGGSSGGVADGVPSQPGSTRLAGILPPIRNSATSLAAWHTRRGVALDITCLPGVELLSSRERELCASVRLLPPQYLTAKEALLREGDRCQVVSRQEACALSLLEPARMLHVYDLQAQCGWVCDVKVAPSATPGGEATANGSSRVPGRAAEEANSRRTTGSDSYSLNGGQAEAGGDELPAAAVNGAFTLAQQQLMEAMGWDVQRSTQPL